MSDLPKPATWWRANDTGESVVVSCTAEVVDGGGTLVVYRRPVDGPQARGGWGLLDECNRPVPHLARPVADFLARFTPTTPPFAPAAGGVRS